MTFEIGDIVNRIEAREAVRGVVIDVQPGSGQEGNIYLISYDEGGQGWWPESLLIASV